MCRVHTAQSVSRVRVERVEGFTVRHSRSRKICFRVESHSRSRKIAYVPELEDIVGVEKKFDSDFLFFHKTSAILEPNYSIE